MMRAIVKEENERERCEVFKEGSMNDSSVPNQEWRTGERVTKNIYGARGPKYSEMIRVYRKDGPSGYTERMRMENEGGVDLKQ